MLVTPRFVFIHIPKTAGRFCRHQIVEHAGPVLYRGGLHAPIIRLPQQFDHLPIVSFVRNPWDWYVSWYFHMRDNNGFNPLFANAVNSGKADFNDIMHYVFDSLEAGTEAYGNLDKYIASEAHRKKESHDLDKSMLDFQRENGCGMLSWRYLFNVGSIGGRQYRIGRYEQLVDDLIDIMESCEVKLSDESIMKIRMASPVGVGKERAKRDFRMMYTDAALIERVLDKERLIIERYNYTFDS